MKRSTAFTAACLAVLVVASACRKHEDKAPARSVSAPEAHADHVAVLAHHKNPKPTDPLRINFERFRVVKADFDPHKIEGGKATIEIDLSSFRTDSDERDDHLKSASYLDVAKLATATITIDNVKQKVGSTYTADANVSAHGISKTYSVTFDVVDRTDTSIKIKGSHTFSRLDFGIGSDPAQNGDEQVGTDVTIDMLLTIPKS